MDGFTGTVKKGAGSRKTIVLFSAAKLEIKPVTSTPKSFCLFLVLLFLSLTTVAFGGEPLESEERFPMKYSSALLLPVKAFDEEFVFFIDSGSSATVFDAIHRPRLGPVVKKTPLTTIAGKDEMDFFASPEIHYGHGWKMSLGENVGVLDLTYHKRLLMTDNVGLCGTDFLRSRILLINFDEKYFQFPSEPRLQLAQSERFTMKRGLARILVRLPELGLKSLTLDTGSSASVGLDPNTFDQLVRRHKIRLAQETLATNGSATPVSARSGFLESLELDQHRFYDLAVHETSLPHLGMLFFRRFNVEFDFSRQFIRFQPGKTIDRKDRQIHFGITPSLEHRERLIIASVDKSGCMAKAGFQIGDELQSVDGVHAIRFFADHILNGKMNLDLEENQLPIRFKRDGVEREVIVTIEFLTNAFPEKPAHEVIESVDDFILK